MFRIGYQEVVYSLLYRWLQPRWCQWESVVRTHHRRAPVIHLLAPHLIINTITTTILWLGPTMKLKIFYHQWWVVCVCVCTYVCVHVCVCVCVCVCVSVYTLYCSKCVSVKSSSCCMQIISSSEEYMDLLLSLGEFALLHNNVQMREATRSLLKLIPSG